MNSMVEGRESCEDDPREGRPSTARTDGNVARVSAAVREDQRKEVRMIAGELGLLKSLMHNWGCQIKRYTTISIN